MKSPFFKGKSKHTRIFSAVTLLLLILFPTLNILFMHLGEDNLAYFDLTPEGYYTLTDKMEEYCSTMLEPEGQATEQLQKIKIIFCNDPDYLVKDFEMRVTYFMALALERRFDRIEVETVNVKYNPTAVAAYKTTSRQKINSTDVIVDAGGKYRIATQDSFWTVNSDGSNFSYNGEYKLASILASLTAINAPVAYFVTDHGEDYYDAESPESDVSIKSAALFDLLTERGLNVKTLKLSEVDKIPEDCALLIINNPKTDLVTSPESYGSMSYVSEAEKIDRFLVAGTGSLVFNKPYDRSLPIFESLLSEWGIAFGNGIVIDEEREYTSPTGDGYNIVAVYDTDEASFGNAFYGDYAGLSSAPDMLFKNPGYVYCSFSDGDSIQEPGTYNTTKSFSTFIGTTDGAYATATRNDTTITADKGYKSLAAVSVRTVLDNHSGEKTYSYIFATNTEDFYSNDILGNSAFANFDIMASVLSNISRTERHASMELGGTSPNSPSFGGKQTVDMTLKEYASNVYSPDGMEVVKVNRAFTVTARTWCTVIVCILPVTVFILGAVVFIKRRYL